MNASSNTWTRRTARILPPSAAGPQTAREAPLEPREAESALIAATLANAQLRISKASALHHANEVAQLSSVRDTLEREVGQKERENREMMTVLEGRIIKEKQHGKNLTSQLEEMRSESDMRVKEAVSSMSQELKDRDELILTLKQRVELLERELESVLEFKHARDKYHAKMEVLDKAYAEEKLGREQDARHLRLELMEARVGFRAQSKMLMQQREKEVESMVRSRLKKKTREIEEQNKELLKEKVSLSLLADDMQLKTESLQNCNEELRRNKELATSIEAECFVRGAKQRHEISLLREQVKTAEDNLDAVVTQYEKRLQKQKDIHAAELDRLRSECRNVRFVAEELRRDLLKMRSISDKLVGQRTELENFFYQALAHVRREMLEERRAKNHSIGFQQPTKKPPYTARIKPHKEPLLIGDRGTQLALPVPSSRKVATEKVSWSSVDMAENGMGSNVPSLPMIAMGGGDVNPHGVYPSSVPQWSSPSSDAYEGDHYALVAEGSNLRRGELLSIPNAPKLKDLQSVEISQMSWSNKERVLQLLFNCLNKGNSVLKPTRLGSEDDAEFLSMLSSPTPDAHTFITE
ncbi:hypothetical protein TRVL_03457 [Trypanosoma vivax]|nr:hypothetical protein TRVL_03457 [Trypanosoma vivax]